MNTLTNPVKILHGKTLYDSSAKVRLLHFINITFTFQECCHGKSFQVCPNYDNVCQTKGNVWFSHHLLRMQLYAKTYI